jgi:hypothetical protein
LPHAVPTKGAVGARCCAQMIRVPFFSNMRFPSQRLLLCPFKTGRRTMLR